jgi:hypothetical protein
VKSLAAQTAEIAFDDAQKELATRWQRGTLVMQPADSSLQSK